MKTKVLSVLIALLLLAACGSKPTVTPAGTLPPIPTATQPPAATTAPVQAASANDITIQGFAFNPASLTIKVGDTVKWTNQDTAAHTVVADDNSWGSGQLVQGSSFSFTFTKAGTYNYLCGVHPRMKGTIIVNP
jgi:plastocyanin